jgi:aldehyde dehydrogenase family 7 protein A1
MSPTYCPVRCSIAVTRLLQPVLERNGLPGAAASLVCGDVDVGKTIVGSDSVQMVSFTGSERVGKEVGKTVQDRFGKVSFGFTLRGEGGTANYDRFCWSLEEIMVGSQCRPLSSLTTDHITAVIVDHDADLSLALEAVLFAAIGTT